MLVKRFLVFSFAFLSVYAIQAQAFKKGIGTGISMQYGVNSNSDVVVWGVESQNIQLNTEKRFLVGPMFQYKNFQKFQFETGLLYGKTIYQRTPDVTIPQDKVEVSELQMPVSFLYNSPSPVKFHSNIVYQAGVVFSRFSVPAQGLITTNNVFYTPAVSGGIRLSTEIRSFGRVEYGVQYVKSLKDRMSLQVENDDAVPTLVSIQQRTGQFKLHFIYYFTPRMYNWSKKRYNLNGLD